MSLVLMLSSLITCGDTALLSHDLCWHYPAVTWLMFVWCCFYMTCVDPVGHMTCTAVTWFVFTICCCYMICADSVLLSHDLYFTVLLSHDLYFTVLLSHDLYFTVLLSHDLCWTCINHMTCFDVTWLELQSHDLCCCQEQALGRLREAACVEKAQALEALEASLSQQQTQQLRQLETQLKQQMTEQQGRLTVGPQPPLRSSCGVNIFTSIYCQYFTHKYSVKLLWKI